MTSEEKLAKILAMRALRTVLQNYVGTIDFHEMTQLITSQSSQELSNGEAEELIRMREILGRKDDKRLEQDMADLDAFKLLLAKQFDGLIGDLKIRLAG